jgi:hypothetical protein
MQTNGESFINDKSHATKVPYKVCVKPTEFSRRSDNLLFSEHEVMWIVYLARLAQRGTRTKRQVRNTCDLRRWLAKKC